MLPRLLPLELFDLITDELRDDVQSLKNCTLSFQSLRFSAQRHLFNTIYLTASSGSQPGSCEALRGILVHSPHLIGHVRELRLYVGQHSPHARLAWLSEENNTHLAFVLKRLQNVRSIHLVNFLENALVWHQLPLRTREAILEAFASPRLRSLTLIKLAFYCTTDYMAIFANSLALKELYMWVACCLVGPRASFVSNASGGFIAEPPMPKFRPQFETIWMKMSAGTLDEHSAFPDTKYCMDAFLHPRASLDVITNLRKFCISIHPEDDHSPIQPLLDKAEKLEELVIEVDVYAAQVSKGLDLSHIPRVYMISLFTLNGLNELFYGVHDRESSRIEELTVEWDITGLDEFFPEMSRFEDMDWWDFEEKMSITAKRVTFLICGRDASMSLKEYLVSCIPVLLPRLAKKGVLNVTYIPDPPSHSWDKHF